MEGVTQKIKVCFLTTSLSTGGIEIYLLRFLRYLKRDEYDITVLVRSCNKGELEEDYHSLGLNVIRQPLGYFNPVSIIQYFRIFQKERYDVICDFNGNFAGLPLWLGQKAGIQKRLVFYRQGRNHFKASIAKNAYNQMMNKLVFHYATHILSNSHEGLKYFFPYRDSCDFRFRIIRNGVNLNEYLLKESKHHLRKKLGLPVDAFVIGHVGRFDPAKNHKTVLKVFKRIKRTIPDAHLVLCGRGSSELEADLKNLEVQANYTLWEYRQDVPQVLKSLDCFLFPSLTEGQPNALIEAMVAGVPFVSSNISAIRECVPVQSSSCLFDARDVEQIASKVLEIALKRPDTSSVQRFAIENFDARKNFEKFEKLLMYG